MTSVILRIKPDACKWLVFLAVMILTAMGVQAKTVAWYRFEDFDGPVTKDTVFANSVDASKYPMYAGVCNFGGNGKYDKAKLTDTPEYMPFMTNGFSTVELNDPVAGKFYSNTGAVSVNNTRSVHEDPHAELFIDDEESLRLQTFTLEFFMRQPDVKNGFRCLACRAGGVYNGANEAFRLEMSVLGGGADYFSNLNFATIDGDPLYDAKGNITNSTVNSCTAYAGRSGYDDGKWHHVAIVVDGAQKKVSFYTDYVLHGSTTYTGDILYQPGYPFAFGGHPQCTYYNCQADFSEIRISDEALAPAQMLHYSQPKSQYESQVDERTLFYFPFEGGTEPITVGEEMKTPLTYTPFLENRAHNPAYSAVNATLWTKAASTNAAAPSATNDVPVSAVRGGLTAPELHANASSCLYATNSLANDWMEAVMLPDSVTYQDLFSDSLTVECFFKMPPSGYDFVDHNVQTHILCMCNGFYVLTGQPSAWTYGRLQAWVGNKTLQGTYSSPTVTSKGFADNKWHHLAVVYDKVADRGELYVDGVLYLWADELPFNATMTYQKNFIVGSSYWRDRWCVGAGFDELRVTRGALRPYEFLTSRAVETSDLAYAGFDTDFLISPYADFFSAAVASSFTAEGSAPVIERTRPGRIIHEGKNGPVVKEKNGGAIRFAGGQLVYPDHGIVTDQADQTVQFFVKSSAAVAGAGLVRVNRDSKNGLGSPSWAVSFADAEGNLALAVDTDALTGQSHTFAAPVADGAWHHVAITFAKVGDDTQATLYRDYVAVETHTFTGGLMTRFRDTNLMLGAGDVANAGFNGWIDELRVTPGVLPPEQFLWAESFGLMMLLR